MKLSKYALLKLQEIMKMSKGLVTMAILSSFFLISCNEASKNENRETTSDSVEKVNNDIEKITSADKDGNELEVTFNNIKGNATLTFNGETIELVAQKSASGIWYKNEHYELRGKGNDMELTKDGKVVFVHNDEVITYSIKNKVLPRI